MERTNHTHFNRINQGHDHYDAWEASLTDKQIRAITWEADDYEDAMLKAYEEAVDND